MIFTKQYNSGLSVLCATTNIINKFKKNKSELLKLSSQDCKVSNSMWATQSSSVCEESGTLLDRWAHQNEILVLEDR